MAVTLRELHQCFQESSSIALFGHINPDADALCSALALKEFISNNYFTISKNNRFYKKKVDIFVDCEEIPDSLKVFSEKHKISINPQPKKHYSLAVALDCSTKERLGKYVNVFESAQTTINIDHHKSNTKYADMNFVMDLSILCKFHLKIQF